MIFYNSTEGGQIRRFPWRRSRQQLLRLVKSLPKEDHTEFVAAVGFEVCSKTVVINGLHVFALFFSEGRRYRGIYEVAKGWRMMVQPKRHGELVWPFMFFSHDRTTGTPLSVFIPANFNPDALAFPRPLDNPAELVVSAATAPKPWPGDEDDLPHPLSGWRRVDRELIFNDPLDPSFFK